MWILIVTLVGIFGALLMLQLKYVLRSKYRLVIAAGIPALVTMTPSMSFNLYVVLADGYHPDRQVYFWLPIVLSAMGAALTLIAGGVTAVIYVRDKEGK